MNEKTHKFLGLILLALVINAIVLKEVPSQSYKVENFVIYDIKGNRYLFYDLSRDLPKDGVVIGSDTLEVISSLAPLNG